VNLTGARIDRDHARLGQNDATTAHIHERVGSAEVNRHVAATETREVREETH
jgi:hypothetical protein